MDECRLLTTAEEIKAFSDPYRLRILNCFYSLGEPSTVKQVADEMGEVPANVYYHVKKLEKVGILKLIYTKDINGIIAKYYEPAAKKFDINKKDIANSISLAALSETQKFISTAYKNSLETFIENMGNGNKQNTACLSLEDVFLTEEEFNEFRDYIMDFCCKHNNRKKSNKNSMECHLFTVLVKKNPAK